MDKKGVLINRLQEQYQQGAEETSLLNTALMLVTELQHSRAEQPTATLSKVSVIMPVKTFEVVSNEPFSEEKDVVPEENETATEEHAPEIDETLTEVIENNILPEAVIEPEVELAAKQHNTPEPQAEPVQPLAINTIAEEKYIDVIDEIPTLAQQQPKVMYELNQSLQPEEPSVNDKLKPQQTETANQLQNEPVKDLRKAIGINDKYTFIRELFRNDEASYERSIKTINGFHILPEAEYWIQREMKYKLGWDDTNPTVKAFYQLVKRRFS